MLAGFAGASGDYDVPEVHDVDPIELQIEVEYCLRLKGFCVLDAGINESLREEAVADLDNLRSNGDRFLATPPEVLDGVLGPQGTAEFCELGFLGAANYADGEALRKVQDSVVYFTDVGKQFCLEAGFQSVVPSLTLAVRGGEPDTHRELTEDTCMSWLSTFKLAKLMIVLFLGPNEGTLELSPYDEEGGTVEVKLVPGTMVILRYDALMRRAVTARDDFALVRWIWARDKTGPRGWRTLALGLQRKMPALRDLFEWAQTRMQDYLNLEDEYGMEQSITPSREWELMMRHHFFKKDRIPAAIRGVSGHIPGQWDPETYWQAVNQGIDFLTKIPHARWDHDVYYDPDPNVWMNTSNFRGGPFLGRTNVKHCSFIDGIELFDNKLFGLSNAESKGMDPQQRHILETTYECMFMAGFRKKDMMNAEIAVYIGTTNAEINYLDGLETGACSGTGAAVAITSNRVSFQLGMMGPSSSVECGMSSATMAVLVGMKATMPQHQHRLDTGGLSIAANVGGVFFSITPFMWPRFNWQMSPAGRCLTFDANATGYVRGEGVANLCLMPYAEHIDKQWTVSEKYNLGTLVGSSCTSNGRSASLSSPSGPVLAECLSEACRSSGISPLDLDGLDCHGVGGLLEDSVEMAAVAGVLRGMKGGSEEVLTVGSNKTSVGALMEASGAAALLKVIFNILYGNQAPSLHLKQLNPHIELDEEAILFNTEGMAYRDRTSFHGSLSQGSYCGMNCALVAWYMVDELKVRRDSSDLEREVFSFWPGGGGYLDSDVLPRQGYFIVGSWTRWEIPEEMSQDGPGSFVYTVTLGPNRFESFQVWLDGDSERVLHPGSSAGLPGSVVLGPTDASLVYGYAWMIEGRSTVYPYRLEHPEGQPGDRYEVRLLCSGKYRTVTWRLLLRAEDEEVAPVVDSGLYYLATDWDAWTAVEMTPSQEVPGVHTVTVQLPATAAEGKFVVVRDRDWGQTFYPAEDESEVLGPDGVGQAAWLLRGRPGDQFLVEFNRSFSDGGDKGKSGECPTRLSWRSLSGAAID